MCSLRFLISLALLALVQFYPSKASAWVTQRVAADSATVELSPDGTAVVSHELLLRVRGGPLKDFTLQGVDPDAVPVGGASLTRARSGQAAGPPIPLEPAFDESKATFEIAGKRGVRTGTYVVRFAYRTNFRTRELLRRSGDWVDLRWDGLSFDDGIDSLSTTFVVPRGKQAPRLPESADDDTVGMVVTEQGVFLSELSRGADRDRFTLTRPHVAKGEQVTWSVRLSAEQFDAASVEVAADEPSAVTPDPPPAVTAPKALSAPYWMWGTSLLAGIGFALLVALRQRLGASSFVFRVHPRVRYLGLLLCMGGSVALALVSENASLAGVLLVGAMLLTLQKSRRPPIEPKGPGRWRQVDLEQVELPKLPKLSGFRWLDASSGVGLVVFAAAVIAFTVAGLRLLGTSPYHSAMTLVYSTALVPLFFTLGAPHHRSLVEEQCEFLLRLAKRLRRRSALSVQAVGRYGLDAVLPDELRLRVSFAEPRGGLASIEVGLGFVDTSLRRLLVPAVIVRVREDSPAHAALPRDAHWSRGRTAEERVAVIRTPLPFLSSCVDTLLDVVARLRKAAPTAHKGRRRRAQPDHTSARSDGRAEVISKLGTPSLPSHASR